MKPITIEKARAMYRDRTVAIRYTSVAKVEIIVFESHGYVVQVKILGNGNKEAFVQSRKELIDDAFCFLMTKEDNVEMI